MGDGVTPNSTSFEGAVTYTISEASLDDAEAITEVTMRSHLESFGEPFYTDRVALLCRWKGYMLREHHPQKAKLPRTVYKACLEGEIVGYVAGHLTERFGCEGELQSIYILREHQRRGARPQPAW